MILIISPNSAIDYYVKGTINVGETNRVDNYNIEIGGKGINIAKSFKKLNQECKVLTFLSGFSGDYIREKLKVDGIQFDYCNILDTNTRINFKLKELDTSNETEFNGSGVSLDLNQINDFINKVKTEIENRKVEHIIICGTNANGPLNLFEEIAKLAVDNNISFTLDANNDDILKLAQYNPFLIKPNLDEFNDLFKSNIEFDNYEEIKRHFKILQSEGINNLLLSLGSKGAVFTDGNYFSHKKITVEKFVSTVGAGDTMLSGFIYNYLKTKDFESAFDFSIMLSAKKITKKHYISESEALSFSNLLERIK